MDIKKLTSLAILTVLLVGITLWLFTYKNHSKALNEQQVSPSSTQHIISQSDDKNSNLDSSSTNEKTVITNENQKQNNQATYEQITPNKAKELMDSESDYILLDVRTQQEYNETHIEGAILIPEHEIKLRAQEVLKNKDQLILVYCRSGRRSKLASQELANQGYTNVKEFGGIYEWQYGTVK